MSIPLQSTASYWEARHFYQPRDVIIVGAGLIGLATALSIRELKPHWSILIIDRHPVGLGASTRNAGFACFGSPSELRSDIGNRDLQDVINLVRFRWEGLSKLRQLVGDNNLRYQPAGGYEVFLDDDEVAFDRCVKILPTLNRELAFAGSDAFSIANSSAISETGMTKVRHMIHCHHEGMIDPGAMVAHLRQLCYKSKIDLLTGHDVSKVGSDSTGAFLQTTDGLELKASCLVMATNGFTKKLIPDLPLSPARNQVILTTPIPSLKIKGTYHHNEGYLYFRNVDQRILLGGARNINLSEESTAEFGTTSPIIHYLRNFLGDIVLPDQPWEIESMWSGILGIGPAKNPLIQWYEDRILIACRMGGMGISIGAAVGSKAAQMVVAT